MALQGIRQQGAAPASVSVIVVGHNQRRYLDACLSGLLKRSTVTQEVIFVDNASSDGSAGYVRARFRNRVRVIADERNVGYVGGMRLGLELARGEYVAVLNADTEPREGWLSPLMNALDALPEAGAVTPKVLLTGGRGQVNALGLDVHVTGLGFNRDLWRRDAPTPTPFAVPAIHGVAFLTRRDLLERVLPIVEGSFLYHEDVQISWLMRLMGYRTYCVPNSVVYHDYSLHMFPAKLYLLERNRWEMLLSTLEAGSFLRYSPLLVMTELLVSGYCLIKGPGYLGAKLRSWNWIRRRRAAILQKRRSVQSLRRIRDSELLKELRMGYPWRQFAAIARTTRRDQPSVKTRFAGAQPGRSGEQSG
jgi:GT2 family glycosyltransferase